jgi:predicted O-methyltransferase YrrM
MELYERVDQYLVDHYVVDPEQRLEAALSASAAAGLPAIQVAPNQGKLLEILARSIGAQRILEIGTLGGYSTLFLARVRPTQLITCELDPRHAEVARKNLAGLGVEIRVGPALDTLATLSGPFDFIFVDADKVNNAEYVRQGIRLSRPGTMIVVDNVVRKGGIVDPASKDAAVLGTRRLHDYVASEPRLTATAIQTVGSKGHDGLLVAIVDAPGA